MTELKLNETPVRTCRNFNINNIKIKDFKALQKQEKFENIEINGANEGTKISYELSNTPLTYGIRKELENEVKEKANHKLKIEIKKKADIEIKYDFDKENSKLVDNIEIIAQNNVVADVLIKYKSKENIENYHNGILKIIAKENSKLNITLVNLLNNNSNNLISIENEIKENANVSYTIVDFGGKHSITNYYSNLIRKLG